MNSTPDVLILNELTADEAFENALKCQEIPEPDPKSDGFEAAIIAKTLHILPLREEDRSNAASEILRAVRKRFVLNAKTEQIPEIAQDVIRILLAHTQENSLDTRTYVAAGVQLTTAVLSLMKRHPRHEKYLYVLEKLNKHCLKTESIREYLRVFEPASNPEATQFRLKAAGLDEELWPFAAAGLEEDAIIGFCPRMPDPEFACGFAANDLAQVLNQDIASLSSHVSCILNAPANWLYSHFKEMNAQARHAIYLILSQKRAFQGKSEIEESRFESWLYSEAADAESLKQYLLNQPCLPHAGSISRVLTALKRREAGDPDWYGKWLREIDADFLPSAHNALDTPSMHWLHFESFWLAQAWKEAGNTQNAMIILQETLASCEQIPQTWLLLADIFIDLCRFGEAENALEQAGITAEQTIAEDSRIQAFIRQTTQKLGRLALREAQKAHDVSPELLELAMKTGQKETFAEAALCAFDSDCTDNLADYLVNAPDGRLLFIEKLAERRDLEHLDEMYRLLCRLEKALPNAPELKFFETLCKLDNVSAALQPLSHALRSIPQTTSLFWAAVDLWIELNAQLNAFDDAVYGIVETLANSHPRATRALMILIAVLPREARPMLQTIMVENLGPEAARKAFERAKNGVPPEPVSTEIPISLDEIGLSMMPATWQMIYIAARTPAPATPEENARQARRESVLAARGISPHHQDSAPEPAQWVHASQPKASDAFNG